MEAKVFKKFVDYIYAESGITLKEGKEALLSARIMKRMRALHLKTHEEYLNYVQSHQDPQEVVAMLDAISTNVTHFFRESDHFDLLAKFLPRLVEAGVRDIRIWSAASSTGEEPYTIAVVAHESLKNTGVQWRVLGTDLSTRVLEKAQQGHYSLDAFANVPAEYMEKCIRPHFKKDKNGWQVRDQIRSHVTFSRLNLSQPPFPMRGPFDVIFCRNVMIYFDQKVRMNLVAEMTRLLRAGGLLMVGHSETVAGMHPDLTTIRASVYRKKQQGDPI